MWNKFFDPTLKSWVNNSISCLDDSISSCAFQNNIDWLKMFYSGGTFKTDFFAWVLFQVYYQIQIPFPVSHLKPGTKTGFEWIWALLSPNSISCWSFQHRKTNQEMELMTCCSSKTMIISGGKSKTDSIAWALLQVYHQNEIPFPLSQLKQINWFCMNLSTTFSKFHSMLSFSK